MTVTYLGGGTIGQLMPGIFDSLKAVGDALNALKAEVEVNGALVQSAIDAVTGAMGDLEDAKDALTAGPIADFNAKVDAAQALLDDLSSIVDATAFLNQALAGIDAGRAFIAGLVPATYLSDQIDGVTAGVGSLQAEANALIDRADDMTDVSQFTLEQMEAVQNVKNALDQAATDALSGVIAYNEQLSQLLASGVHAFWCNAQLSSLGSELGAALPSTGIGGTTTVAGPVLIVDIASTDALAGLEAIFGAP